jgi:hypothetical protein
MSWTDELRDECRRLFIEEGISASETARRLNHSEAGRRIGAAFSRNAVIGIAHRGNWARSPEVSRQNIVRSAQVSARPRPARKPPRVEVGSGHLRTPPKPTLTPIPPAPALIPATARPWEERARVGQCAWPVEVGGAIWSCCAPVTHARPSWAYCPGHTTIMSVPAKTSTRELIREVTRRYA